MNKALFLDRDGVINEDTKGYTHKLEDLKIIDGITEICLEAQRRGYLLIIVTNQGGIALGYYTEKDFQIFMNGIYQYFAKHGVFVTKTYFAPYHPKSIITEYSDKKLDIFRKPNSGMIIQAQKDYNINLQSSILIGDKQTDIQAGLNAEIGRNILLAEQHTPIF